MDTSKQNSNRGSDWAEASIYKEKLKVYEELLAEEKEKFEAQQQMLEMTTDYMQNLQDELESSRENILKQNNYISDSINYAQRIQSAIQPRDEHISTMFAGHFVLLNAKDKLSGDIHYFQRRGHICMAAAIDCTGHGIPGAMLTMIVTSICNEIVNTHKNIFDPASMLCEIDKRLYSIIHNQENELQINDGLDIALVCYNEETNTIKFAGAHRPLYYYRGGKIKVYKGTRTGLGAGNAADRKIKNHTIKVKSGDKLYIFSDGFPDQFGGENNSKYMIGRFRKLLCRLAPFPLEDQKKLLQDEFLNWKGSFPQTDDVLVIGLTF